MKQNIELLIKSALNQLQANGELPEVRAMVMVEATKDKNMGITHRISPCCWSRRRKNLGACREHYQTFAGFSFVNKTEIAGPGFINFYLTADAMIGVIEKILTEKENYGRCKIGREKRVLVEFLSANPNGPLHVGHGRGAAFGDIISNLLEAVGFKTYREYYVNDAGRQMDILTASIWLRYLALCGEDIIFPVNAYRGEYVIDIAKKLFATHNKQFQGDAKQIFDQLPPDETEGGDKEVYIDEIILRTKKFLGEHYQSYSMLD